MQIMRDCATAAGASVIAWYSLNSVLNGGERRLRDLATAVRSPDRGCPGVSPRALPGATRSGYEVARSGNRSSSRRRRARP
jgi:hypothetical protein